MTWSADARAVDVEVTGSSVAQGYEVASPWGYEIERRRYLQTLGFGLYHLQGDYRPNKADYNVKLLFRVDSEFGLGAHLSSDIRNAETDYEVAGGSHFVPGLQVARFDLMQAYVEGRNLADGWLSFKAGRQTMSDVLGWWSFDGASFRLHTPAFFDVEVYGGFEQRGGIPLGTSRYESQGVWRGSHSGFDEDGQPLRASDFPSYQFASYAPAFGIAVESAGPNWVHGRFTYRRVYNTGEAFAVPFPEPAGGGYRTVDGLRISSERIGYAANINKTDLGGIKGGFTYDLYNQLVPTAFGGIEFYATDKVTVGLDADHYNPTFDADSIFNWFTKNPTTTGTGRVEARFTREIDLSASGGVRVWGTEGDPAEFAAIECAAAGLPANCKDEGTFLDASGADENARAVREASRAEENRPMTYIFDGIGQLAARYRSGLGKIEIRSMIQAGGRGHRAGADIIGEKTFDGGRYAIGARFSVFDFGDGLASQRPEDPDTTSFQYVLGAGFKPFDVTKLNVEFEHAINERVGQRFRLLARLDVAWGR